MERRRRTDDKEDGRQVRLRRRASDLFTSEEEAALETYAKLKRNTPTETLTILVPALRRALGAQDVPEHRSTTYFMILQAAINRLVDRGVQV